MNMMGAAVVQIGETRKDRVRRAIDEWRGASNLWVLKTLALGVELKCARDDVGGDDIAFGKWLVESECGDLGKNDRAALIKMAENFDISNKVLEATKRRSLQLIWQEEIKPLISPSARKDDISTNSAPNRGVRVKVPDGQTLSELARRGHALMAEGMHTREAAKQVGLALHAFTMARDIVVLSERTDLNAEDAETVRSALLEMDRERRTGPAWERIRTITERMWGKKGQRLKSDKVRAEKFDSAIDLVLGTCEAASDIEIPYVAKANVGQKIEKLEEAISSLQKLMERIRESAQ